MADPAASSIAVTVRVRPFTIREAAQLTKYDDAPLFLGDGSLAGVSTPKLSQKGLRSVIKVVDDRCLVFDPPEDNPVHRFSRSVVPTTRRVKDQTFGFDKVFDENVSQADVYEATTRGLLDGVLDGYNATVFAYGATGCGKTHTITGTPSQPGIIFMTMQELFERIDEQRSEKQAEISLSYLEIYNETIRDLLEPSTNKQGLQLREDANQAVSVVGLSSHQPRNVEQVMEMIIAGNENRTVSPTAANATSSRSHAVLQINVSSKDRNADVNEPHVMATLSIIDLAGSERASATLNKGERLTEGANINKSLLALGSCINALCDPRKKNHIPYRNSKLTRLLKFSLGGNCKTVMIVCVSPSSAHFDETQNTLRYANRAKNIQTKVTKNVYNVNRHVKDFLKKIDEQMALITELRAQQKDSDKLAFVKFKKANEKKESLLREGLERIRAAYDHSAAERQEKIKCMINQRRVERRIEALTALVRAFENFGQGAMPLQEMSVAAQGQLVELETSRRHFRQKLGQLSWDRSLDAALETGNRLLRDVDGIEQSVESGTLIKEAEILRARAEREILSIVLEAERTPGDNSIVQTLMGCTLGSLASLSRVLSASEADTLSEGRVLLQDNQKVCSSELWRMIRPGTEPRPSSPSKDWYPPSKSGTPRKKKMAIGRAGIACRTEIPGSVQKLPPMSLVPPSPVIPVAQAALARLATMSPKRRKIHTTGAAKRGVVIVSGTPKKNKQARKKGVTWRDDRPGSALAEFKTPTQVVATPDPTPTAQDKDPMIPESVAFVPQAPESPRTRIPSPNPAMRRTSRVRYDPLAPVMSEHSQISSSPVSTPPELSSSGGTAAVHKQLNERMKVGFLQKKSKGPISPLGLPQYPYISSSESEASSPLRELKVNHASNRQPLTSDHNYIVRSQGLDGACDISAADQSFQGPTDENSRSSVKLFPRASFTSPSLPRPSPLRKLSSAPRDSYSPITATTSPSPVPVTVESPIPSAPRLSVIEEQSVGLNLSKTRHRRSSGSSTTSSSGHHDRGTAASSRKSSSSPVTAHEGDGIFTSGQTRRMGGAIPAPKSRESISYLLSPRMEGGGIAKVGGSARKAGRRTTFLGNGNKGRMGLGEEMGRMRESIGVIGDSGSASRAWR